jgi:hypothetical protein
MDNKKHWEEVYRTKSPQEVSWTQEIPTTSLRLIQEANISKDEAIIDIGGGDSKLVDYLIQEGYTNITVLDISKNALEKAKIRLGDKANLVEWIESDINTFVPKKNYALWHDRAVFHFLNKKEEIKRYNDLVTQHTTKQFIIGTFSNNGPIKCSGLDIKQYTAKELKTLFGHSFELVTSFNEDHTTPFNTIQNFTFASFERTYNCC